MQLFAKLIFDIDKTTRHVRIPANISLYLRRRISQDSGGVLSAQFVPSRRELDVLHYEDGDPLSETCYARPGRIVHRYPDRALVLVTDSCAAYCRFCFRRYFVAGGGGGLSQAEVEEGARYLASVPEVKELLLSGGDPLVLPDSRLEAIVGGYRAARPDMAFRLSTRIPTVLPSRVTAGLCELLAGCRPLRLVVHINHGSELSPETTEALVRLRSAEIPMISQAVLLRGVNDSVESLADLYTRLYDLRVKPYYLFQGDMAAGTAHFRVNVDRGLALVNELSKRLPAEAMPTYAVDLVDGGGKAELTPKNIVSRDREWLYVRSKTGEVGRYPREAFDRAGRVGGPAAY